MFNEHTSFRPATVAQRRIQMKQFILHLLSVCCLFTASSASTTHSKSKEKTSSDLIASLTKSYSSDVNQLLEGVYSANEGKSGYFLLHLDRNKSLARRWCNAKIGPNQMRLPTVPPLNDLCPKTAVPSFKPCLSPDKTKPQTGRTLFVISPFNALQQTLQLLANLEKIPRSYDIVVIDRSSTDGTVESLVRKVSTLHSLFLCLSVCLLPHPPPSISLPSFLFPANQDSFFLDICSSPLCCAVCLQGYAVVRSSKGSGLKETWLIAFESVSSLPLPSFSFLCD
jgi:hypothetical protein